MRHQLFRVALAGFVAGVVLGHGPQTLSATSCSLVMKQLEGAGHRRERLRREWFGPHSGQS